MITRAPRPISNFYFLDKKISEDDRLSWAARGLLIFLLGKPDSWEISIGHLEQQTRKSTKKTGKDGIYSLLSELEGVGYVTREQQRDRAGKFRELNYVVSETTQKQTDEPHRDFPDTADPYPGNPPQVSIDGVQKMKKTTTSGGGDDFWKDVDIQDYILLVATPSASKRAAGITLGAYLYGAKKRIKEQGGLLDVDLADLKAARSASEQAKKYDLDKSEKEEKSPGTLHCKAISSAVWDEARSLIKGKLNESEFQLWIEPLLCVRDDQRQIKLVGPDPYFCNWVKDNYLCQIIESLPGREVVVGMEA